MQADAESAAKKKEALNRELKSMGREVPAAKEPEVKEHVQKVKPLTYQERLEKRKEMLAAQKAEKEQQIAKVEKTPGAPSKPSTITEPKEQKQMTHESAPKEGIDKSGKPIVNPHAKEEPMKVAVGKPAPSDGSKKSLNFGEKLREQQKAVGTSVVPRESAQSPTIHKQTVDLKKPMKMTVEEHEEVTLTLPSPKKPGPDVAALRERQRQAALLKEQKESAATQQTATKPEVKTTGTKAAEIKTESPTSEKAASTDTPQKPAAASSVFEELLKKRKRID